MDLPMSKNPKYDLTALLMDKRYTRCSYIDVLMVQKLRISRNYKLLNVVDNLFANHHYTQVQRQLYQTVPVLTLPMSL